METTEEFEAAVARLARRSSTELALFIAQLALRTGPVGEQAGTFILADKPEELIAYLSQRISRLPADSPDQRGADVAQRLDDIVGTIGSTLLPRHPTSALNLLVQLLHLDGTLLDANSDHDDDITLSLLFDDNYLGRPATIILAGWS